MIFTKFPKLINFFTCWKKLAKKIFFLCRATPTAWATHKNIFYSDSCTPVHWILFFLQIHVPGYMKFRFFFKSMYPGTWNLDFYTILMCSSGGGGGPAQKKPKNFANFFQHVKKFINFGNFVKIKVAKFKLNHLG